MSLPKIWKPANIYPTASLGADVSVGAFTEIGPNVIIGDRTRIGKGCFIPDGVYIGRDCFIGPHCLFANDMYPPSGKDSWEKTTVKDRVRIGAGVCIRPGVTIGEGTLIGMGSVVTKDTGEYEVWMGNPARMVRNLTEIERK